MAIVLTNPTNLHPSPVMLKYSTIKILADVLTTRFGKKPTVAGKNAGAQLAQSVAITVPAVAKADVTALLRQFDSLELAGIDFELRSVGSGVRLSFFAATA